LYGISTTSAHIEPKAHATPCNAYTIRASLNDGPDVVMHFLSAQN
jgi:hypothetical protein